MPSTRAPDITDRASRGPRELAPRASLADRGTTSKSGSILTTCWPAVAGGLLAFAAFPPVDWWPLAWFAPVLWLLVIRRRELSGRRPYLVLWLAGFAFWFPVLHWLMFPDSVTIIGWFALSMYLACYLPVSVAICRVAVHRLRVPLIVAAPITWSGLELAQSHLLTGFNMASLAHSQWHWLPLIQISDLAGGYAVTFLIIFVAACVATIIPLDGRRAVLWPLLAALGAVALTLSYGYWRLDHAAGKTGPTIALIQGSIDTELKHDPVRQREVYPHYLKLSQRAMAECSDLDLVVWPETMFRESILCCPAEVKSPGAWQGTRQELEEEINGRRSWIGYQAELLGAPLLLGIDTVEFGSGYPKRYNSALFVDRQGRIGARYDKMHPVLFGEYVPLADRFEWLASLSPIGAGIDSGDDVPVFEVAQARLAANICYESAIPHVIRRQVTRLREEGQEPDILVNLTNDGWFRGSSELDLHLTCAVFRAIECRKPFLIAANTGFSAWIDADGRIAKQGPRRAADVIIARPTLDNRRSLYLVWGDWPAGVCLLAACGFGLVGLWDRAKQRS
jgi:apolipoprotein N-acyltransferase